ncbi:unnamed protein product [Lactuca saligna]|uniref:Uncharacterized protein n=1 Tax=Lactuca saligna TaxID=75948 RepID=A0AA35YMR3_LACSI|nr:unnamed protein product [Lactuca saligna]
MHIIHVGSPESLKSILGDSKSMKARVGTAGDARKVFNDHNVWVILPELNLEFQLCEMESRILILSEWNLDISYMVCAFSTILGYDFWCNSQVYIFV